MATKRISWVISPLAGVVELGDRRAAGPQRVGGRWKERLRGSERVRLHRGAPVIASATGSAAVFLDVAAIDRSTAAATSEPDRRDRSWSRGVVEPDRSVWLSAVPPWRVAQDNLAERHPYAASPVHVDLPSTVMLDAAVLKPTFGIFAVIAHSLRRHYPDQVRSAPSQAPSQPGPSELPWRQLCMSREERCPFPGWFRSTAGMGARPVAPQALGPVGSANLPSTQDMDRSNGQVESIQLTHVSYAASEGGFRRRTPSSQGLLSLVVRVGRS